MKIYAIRFRDTKLFSNGGTSPSAKKNGKIWGGMGAIKNHINLAFYTDYREKEIILSKEFYCYINADLIIMDTEELGTKVDDEFLPNYLRTKVVDILDQKSKYGQGYKISQETKKILCL